MSVLYYDDVTIITDDFMAHRGMIIQESGIKIYETRVLLCVDFGKNEWLIHNKICMHIFDWYINRDSLKMIAQDGNDILVAYHERNSTSLGGYRYVATENNVSREYFFSQKWLNPVAEVTYTFADDGFKNCFVDRTKCIRPIHTRNCFDVVFIFNEN